MMRPLIAAVLALGAVFAVQGWKAHIYAQGDAAGAAAEMGAHVRIQGDRFHELVASMRAPGAEDR